MSALDPGYLAQRKVAGLYAAYSLPIPIEIASTSLRLWAQIWHHRKGLLFDDFLMIGATICSVGICIIELTAGPSHGMGRHIEAVSRDDLTVFELGNFIFAVVYIITVSTTKLSVLALYYRAFPSVTLQRVVISTAVLIIAWMIAMEIAWISFCKPVEAYWRRELDGTCVDAATYEKFFYFSGGSNLVLDVWVFILPLSNIVRLRVSTRKKIGLGCLFSIGLAACATTAIRLTYIACQTTLDPTWDIYPLAICSVWEPVGAILCANLPMTYKPIASWFCNVRDRRSPDERHRTPDRSLHSWSHRHMFAKRKRHRHPLDVSTDNCTRNMIGTRSVVTENTFSQGMSIADTTITSRLHEDSSIFDGNASRHRSPSRGNIGPL
ncbi:hypothetical protein BDV06DRAFT_221496 [Aspergillus oleicola]